MEKSESKLNSKKASVFRAVRRFVTSVSAGGSALMLSSVAFALEEGASPSLVIDFDVGEMMAVAQPIVTAMMPVVYISAGLGIAFMIINAMKSAFR